MIRKILIILLGQLAFVAASSLPKLTCNILRQPDGSFWYALSKPPPSWLWSNGGEITWEDANKTSIIYKSAAVIHKDERLVLNVTDAGIVMNECRKMFFKVDCPTRSLFEEAVCDDNCSLISAVDPQPSSGPIMGNNTNCIFTSLCRNNLELGLFIGIGVATILAAVCLFYLGLFLWKLFRRSQRRSACSCCGVGGGHVERTNVKEYNDDLKSEMAIMMKEVEIQT